MTSFPRLRRARRFPALIGASVTVALGLTACSSAPADTDTGRPVVLTTFTVLQDIAQNVAGDHLQVESITKVGAEIHGYEPTPGDLQRAANASLILDNGLGLEAWFEQFVTGLDVPHVVVSEGIVPIDIVGDTYDGKPNPHAWMSPQNVHVYVDNMVAAFSELDPDHAADFAANGAAYQAKLRQVQDDLTASLSVLPANQRALVSCEGAFSYLARDVGLEERYIWPVNAEQQATPSAIADTIDFVTANKVPAVFCESTVSAAPMEQVARSTGAQFGGLLYVDSLSEPGGPVPTYLDLLSHDTRTIVQGLTGEKS